MLGLRDWGKINDLNYMRSLIIFTTLALLICCKAQQSSSPTVSDPVVSTPAVSISGAEWKLMKMGDRDLSAFNPPVTLKLDETRKGISGHGGCNGYFGGYLSSGETISFTGIGSTKMFCQDTQAIEDAYFKALSTIQSYKAESNKLYLLAEGNVILEFRK